MVIEAPLTTVKHPLQPLSKEEVKKVVDIIKMDDRYNPSIRFVSIVLKEPSKETVLHFSNGDRVERGAFIVLFDNKANKCFEVTLNINSEYIKYWIHIPGMQPTMTIDEQIECERAVLENEAFKTIMAKYGVTDMDLVMVDIWSAGNYGHEEESTMRLARPLCFVRTDKTSNGYAHPIEGVKPVVDLNTMKIIRIEDLGYWKLPPNEGNYSTEKITNFRTDIKPIEIIQPEGPSFTVDGYEVSWQKWNLVIGFNAREGLTLHNINYNDEGRKRSILYRASLSEMVVPYGDPTDTQKRKNAFDTGEYGMGMCANSLTLGCDCLGYIKYFDAHLTNSKGEPLTIQNAICIHEEDYGILWKHTDRRLGLPEVRRSRRLVISSVSTVENYEYGFFWYLYQDGNIQFEIKLTGILSLGAFHEGMKPKYGNLIAPQLYAPNHQHFFSMRLDFDLDGEANTIYQVDIVPDAIDENNAFENAFFAKSTPLETEQSALGNMNLETARYWKIVNETSKNYLGEPVGYKFIPGDNCMPFASKKSSWRKRAGFVDHHVWVTPYEERELYAAGDYPNQHIGGDGLIKWVEKDREVRNKDVVFWYTMGHTHIPRIEDYPVMPTAYIGFLLKPLNFFNGNPANDVPPMTSINKSNGTSCCK